MSNKSRHMLRVTLEQLAQDARDQAAVQQQAATELKQLTTPDQAVSPLLDMVVARQDAENQREYVSELREVETDANDIRDVVALANESGGLPQQGFALLQLQLDHLHRRCGLESFSVIPAPETFQGQDKQTVSLEQFDALVNTIQKGVVRLEAGSSEAVAALLQSHAQTLPIVKERLCHVEELAKARQDEIEGNVVFGDGPNILLSVDGQVPDDLITYMQRYALLGQALFEKYIPAGFAAAMEVSTLPDTLNFTSPEDFWKTVAEKMAKVQDPRAVLTEDQLGLSLPNGGPLFGDKVPVEMPEGGNPVLKLIAEFNESRKVCEQSTNDTLTKIEEGQAGYGRKALALQDIRVICRSLCELLCAIDLGKYYDQSKAVRTDAMSSVSSLKARYAEATPEMKMLLADQFGQLVKFADTVYLLSDWPVLNYLSNLIFTVNGFLLYAERSLLLPEGGVADEVAPTPETPSVDPNAPPVPPTDGVSDPAAAAAGDPNAAAAPSDAEAQARAEEEKRASTELPTPAETPPTPAPEDTPPTDPAADPGAPGEPAAADGAPPADPEEEEEEAGGGNEPTT